MVVWGPENDWYWEYLGNSMDTGIAVNTSNWTRLSIVNNGTSIVWYINGVQVYSAASSSIPATANFNFAWTAVTQQMGSSVAMYLDYVSFQKQVAR